MPVKQHVQEIGGQEGRWGGGPLLSLWLCCAGAKGPGTPQKRSPSLSGHPREWAWSSFLFSMALGSRHEHSSRMSHDMGKGIT